MLNIFKIVFVIIGTIIGAGFASGQEIFSFFVKYGIVGFVGIVLSTLLMSIIIYKTLKIIKEDNIKTYKDFLGRIIKNENKNLKQIILNIVNVFLLISFYIMVAGFSMYFYQELNTPKIYGGILICVLLLITFSKNINGVIKINNLLIPILIILFIVLGIKKIETIQLTNYDNSFKWVISSILYASYNTIVLIPILIDLKKYISKERKITIITGSILLILSTIIYFVLYTNIDFVKNVEIPTVYIAGTLGRISKLVYGAVILIAIFTSAVSAGYGFLINTCKNSKMYKIVSILICLSSILISKIGFSNLINYLYPLFGFLGTIQIIFLLKT